VLDDRYAEGGLEGCKRSRRTLTSRERSRSHRSGGDGEGETSEMSDRLREGGGDVEVVLDGLVLVVVIMNVAGSTPHSRRRSGSTGRKVLEDLAVLRRDNRSVRKRIGDRSTLRRWRRGRGASEAIASSSTSTSSEASRVAWSRGGDDAVGR
jgi:hypothetical protein